MAEPLIAIRNTAPMWLKGASDSTIRNHFILAYLRKEGRMTFNYSGVAINWLVKARQPIARQLQSGQGTTYDQSQIYESLTIPYAGLHATDSLDHKVKLMNKGELAIVDLAETKMDELLKTVSRGVSSGFYNQNTSDDNDLVGIRTPCIAHGSVAAGDIVAALSASASYGGKSVALGALGGSWSAVRSTSPSSVLANDWPMGNGSPEYDYLSPKLLNYSSTGWGTGSTRWSENCEMVMRRGLSYVTHLSGTNNTPNVYLLAQDLMDEFKDQLTNRERLFPENYVSALGFAPGKLLEYNGAIVASDYYCPAGYGYALNAQEMELVSLHDNLFFMDGPTYNHLTLSDDFLVGFYGNYRFNPKHIVEFGAYA